jgi:hypothetical protein
VGDSIQSSHRKQHRLWDRSLPAFLSFFLSSLFSILFSFLFLLSVFLKTFFFCSRVFRWLSLGSAFFSWGGSNQFITLADLYGGLTFTTKTPRYASFPNTDLTSFRTDVSLPLFQPHHLALSYDTQQLTVFIDGKPVAQVPSSYLYLSFSRPPSFSSIFLLSFDYCVLVFSL